MKTKSPQVSVIQDETKKKKDGTSPLYIMVCWKGSRAKESCRLSMTKKDFSSGLWKRLLKKRLSEIDDKIDELMSDRKPFTASDCLNRTMKNSPLKVVTEMSSIKKLGEGTVTGYIYTIHALQNYFGEDFTLSDITLHQMMGFARHSGVSPTTVCGHLKRTHSLLQFAFEKGYLSQNVMSGWKFKSDGYKPKDKPRSRNRGDITIIIKYFEMGNESAGIWLSGYYFCGLALTDLMGVDWENIEKIFDNGNWFYHTVIFRKKTKESANIVTPIFPLTEKLYKFLLTKPWRNFTVKNYSNKINKDLKKIDKTLTYYQCRHSFCSMMVASGVSLNTIASMMGRSVNGISAYIVRISEVGTLAKASMSLKKTELLEEPPEDWI